MAINASPSQDIELTAEDSDPDTTATTRLIEPANPVPAQVLARPDRIATSALEALAPFKCSSRCVHRNQRYGDFTRQVTDGGCDERSLHTADPSCDVLAESQPWGRPSGTAAQIPTAAHVRIESPSATSTLISAVNGRTCACRLQQPKPGRAAGSIAGSIGASSSVPTVGGAIKTTQPTDRSMNRKMNRRTKIGVGIAAGAVVLAAAGMGVAAAGGDETPVTGPATDQARAVATQAVPGGKAGEVDQQTAGYCVTSPRGAN
jgi:hypothetical protein